MERLFTIDLKDYDETFRHFRRPSARGIIACGEGKIALVYSLRDKYYKFPGGGIHSDEAITDALIREVSEEVGLSVVPESIREFGSVMRLQKGKEPGVIFEQENFYYFCDVRRANTSAAQQSPCPEMPDETGSDTQDLEIGNQCLDGYEAEAGYVLRVVPIEEAISVDENFRCDDIMTQVMIEREARVLRMIAEAEEFR